MPERQGAGARDVDDVRVVKADLGTLEPLAERLRRCAGDTGPQKAHFFPVPGGSAPPLTAPRAGLKRRDFLALLAEP